MLNTILGFIHARMEYKRGYDSGLPGLIAIILFILFIVFFKQVTAVLEFIGVIPFLESIGIITSNPEETFSKLIAFGVVSFICMILIVLISIGIVYLIPVFGFVFLIVAAIILSPMVILNYIGPWKKGGKHWKARFLGRERFEVSGDKVRNDVNRMPKTDEKVFYIGVTKDNKDYFVLPHIEEKESHLKCQRIELHNFEMNKTYPLFCYEPHHDIHLQDFDYFVLTDTPWFRKFMMVYSESILLDNPSIRSKNHLVKSYSEYVKWENMIRKEEYEDKLNHLLIKLNEVNDTKRPDYPHCVENVTEELKQLQNKYNIVTEGF
ncbi:hypothetical protein [Bacillus sp. SM2101]|uniref:hypothetical protein n=1 Tax=Bacillus sp. SM2101 TaxID=2805366 RepID=UPI001BDEDCF5|nr:hypothetical protein [Bacillus sp. SM2101]